MYRVTFLFADEKNKRKFFAEKNFFLIYFQDFYN